MGRGADRGGRAHPGGGAPTRARRRVQLQTAIAAVHAEARTWQETDWLQITVLYQMLEHTAPQPTVTLNRAVAVGMAFGPEQGPAIVDPLLHNPAMRRHHRTHAVRAHLLERAGRRDEAVEAYGQAARLTASIPEQRYLGARHVAVQTKGG